MENMASIMLMIARQLRREALGTMSRSYLRGPAECGAIINLQEIPRPVASVCGRSHLIITGLLAQK